MSKIELLPPADIRSPYTRNPRVRDAAADAVAEPIRRFGSRQPIVADEAGVIVGGHVRGEQFTRRAAERVCAGRRDSQVEKTAPVVADAVEGDV